MQWIDGHHFDLVPRQGSPKLLEFWDTARAFRDSRKLMQFLGFYFLDGTSSFKIVVVMVSGISASTKAFVTMAQAQQRLSLW